MTITKASLVDKLRRELLIQMQRELGRLDKPVMFSEQGDVSVIEDPVSKIMDRLIDLET